MKTLKLTLLAAAATFAMGGAAVAQESPVSFNLGVASDYVYRGVSQTDGGPQVFGGVDLAIGEMGYAGIWASNVDFGDSTKAEVDFYAGVTPTIGIASTDFGVVYYSYVDAPSGSDYNFWEFYASATVPAGPAEIGAAINYSPEFFGGTGDAFYYEVNAAAPLTERLSLSGAVGRQELDGGGDY
ncbi:MAG: TorF family putative porin, partial [Phenylobacterium sp.]|uniref:TorF family putative porin n=1 Tax=Phenylobacterium sp. TaxID=1871053 RepID=UPI002725D3C9